MDAISDIHFQFLDKHLVNLARHQYLEAPSTQLKTHLGLQVSKPTAQFLVELQPVYLEVQINLLVSPICYH